MKVALLSKAMTVPSTHSKAELIGQHCDLTLLIPERWPGYVAEGLPTPKNFNLKRLPIKFSGKNHLHFYLGLKTALAEIRPDILHIDEEPFSLVTTQAIILSRALRIIPLVFTWQNIKRRYPFPFNFMESFVFDNCSAIIAGNQEAVEVLRRKGFAGLTPIIPQFGILLEQFSRSRSSPSAYGINAKQFSIAYVGRLVPEKGIDTILKALTYLTNANLYIAGLGPEENSLKKFAVSLGISQRVIFLGGLSSTAVIDFIASVDVLVLPSKTKRTWKEQFGRVLIEAMAVGTIPVGSDSGEIPNVIGNSGLIFPEGNDQALAKVLSSIAESPLLHQQLISNALLRAQRFTQQSVANETLALYRALKKRV